jgi:hypothetical protein
LVTPELIEEHRSNPFGHHSAALEVVLAYLRSDPMKDKPQYVCVCLEPEREWVIGEYSRVRGAAVVTREEPRCSSFEEVEHAIFCQRLTDLGLKLAGDTVNEILNPRTSRLGR